MTEGAGRLRDLFERVLELEPSEREAFIGRECAGDTDLAGLLRDLITHAPSEDDPFLGGGDGGQPRAQAGAVSPSHIGPYRVIRELGRGGMGIVYEAEQESPRRRVALKVVHRGPGGPAVISRFRREVHALAQLQHRGIAHIYESGTAEIGQSAWPFFAMELIDGRPLDEHAENHRLTVLQRLELLARVCDAVQHAHQKGIIHRDLKPANVLVVDETTGTGPAGSDVVIDSIGQPKILDFGVARFADPQTQATMHTHTGQLVGTLAYMSPEQIDGSIEQIDTRTDVYALGVVLYKLLAGRLPHDLAGLTFTEAARVIREVDAPRLGSIDPALRGDIATIAAKALEKTPDRRYGTAAGLAEDLRRCLRDEPIVARPPSTLYHVSKFARRNKGLVAGFGAAVAAIIVGAVLAVAFALAESDARRHAEDSAYRASIAAAVAALAADDIATAERHLSAAPDRLRGWEWRHLAGQLDGSLASARLGGPPPTSPDSMWGKAHVWFSASGDQVHIARGMQGVWHVETRDAKSLSLISGWTSDMFTLVTPIAGGRRLLAKSEDGQQSIVAIENGKPVPEAQPPIELGHLAWIGGAVPDAIGGALAAHMFVDRPDADELVPPNAVFSPVGDRYCAWAATAVRVGGADDTFDLELHPEGVGGAAFSPDGCRLITGGRNRRLAMFDLNGRGARIWEQREAHNDAILAVAVSPDGSVVASGGQDRVLRLWDAGTGENLEEHVGHRSPVLALAFDPTAERIATCSADHLKIWKIGSTRSLDQLTDHRWQVRAMGITPDGSLLATAARDIRLWDVESGRLVASIDNLPGFVSSLVFSSTGDELGAYVQATASLLFFDVRSGRLLRTETLDRHRSELSQSDPVGGIDPVFGTWDVSKRQHVSVGSSRVLCAVMTGDEVRVVEPGARFPRCVLPVPGVASVLLYDKGRHLAVGTTNSEIRLFDVNTGRSIGVLRGHTEAVMSLAELPGQGRLVSGSDDRTIRIWDLRTGEDVAQLRGHTDTVWSLTATPDGRTIFSSSGDHTVRRWDLRPAAERLRAASEHDLFTAELLPRVTSLLADLGDATAVADRIASDATLSDRQRQVAAQVLLRTSLSQTEGR